MIAGNPLLVDGGRAAPPRSARVARPAGRRSTSIATSPASSRTISCRRPTSSSATTSPTPGSACRRGRTCSTRRAWSRPPASGARSGGSSRGSVASSASRVRSTKATSPRSSRASRACSSAAASSLDELKQQPGGVMLPPLAPGALLRRADRHRATARSTAVPPIFDAAIAGAAAAIRRARSIEPAGRLRLITKRDRFMHNSWFHNVEKLKRRERARNYLFVHPDDARRLGLADGVRGARAERRRRDRAAGAGGRRPDAGRRRRDARLGPRASATGMRVASERPGVNVNRLLPSGPGSFDPLSNMAYMTGIPGRGAASRTEGRMRDTVFIHTNRKQRLGALVSQHSLKTRSATPTPSTCGSSGPRTTRSSPPATARPICARAGRSCGSRTICNPFRRSASMCRASWATPAAPS